MIRPLCAASCALIIPTLASAQTISLAGTAEADSIISESAFTGVFGQISQGTGAPGDVDAPYLLGSDPPALPSGADPIDLFPNETAFSVGSLSYDTAAIMGLGVETTAATAIDLTNLFDPTSATSDISGVGFDLLFPGTGIVFGALDAADTVTFTDGDLTSIDLEIPVSIVAFFGTFTGTFGITGNEFALDVNDTQGFSTVVFDIRGTVASVVPTPGAATLALVGAAGLIRRRR